jgi:hypothetical protein
MAKLKSSILPIMAPSAGINKNLPKNLIKDAMWSDGNNIHFGPGYMEKVGGWRKFMTDQLEGTVMAIDNYFKFNGDSYLMFITTRRVYYYDPVTTTVVDITGSTPLTGESENIVITENAQDWFIITNGVDPIKYWDGVSASIADLPGLTDADGGVTSVRAKAMLYMQNFLILFNTIENGVPCPQRMRNSQINDITKWKKNTDGSGESFWGDLTDGVDWGVRLMPFANYVVAYKERSIQILSYVGGDLVWDKRPAIIGTGLLAPRAIIDMGDEHIFIGPDNIYSFDLVDVKIAGDDIEKEFFRLLDPGKANLTTAFFIEETPEAWFAFVSTTSPDGLPDKAVVYNTDTKAWSIRDLPFTCYGYYNLVDDPVWDTDDEPWDTDDTAWDDSRSLANAPINLAGDKNGYIYVFDGNSKDGADLSCFVRTKLFDFKNPFAMKRAKRIQFMVSREGAYNLLVRVGTVANVDEEIEWSEPVPMSLDKTSPPWIDIDVTSRYMMFEFSTLKADQPFRITGYAIYYETRGAF